MSLFTQSTILIFTCDVEILDWSWRAVRSEDDTLAGAPRWSRMLTFLSLSAREIARGDVLPKSILCMTLTNHTQYKKIHKILHEFVSIAWAGNSPDCWTREAGLEMAWSGPFLTLLAAPEVGPGGRPRDAEPRGAPPILSSLSSPVLLSRSPSSDVRLAPLHIIAGTLQLLSYHTCISVPVLHFHLQDINGKFWRSQLRAENISTRYTYKF